MANRNQPSRYESSMLAAGLAVAGTLFVSDKLSSLAHFAFTLQTFLQAAGILMIAAGICLLLVEWPTRKTKRSTKLREGTKLSSEGSSG